MPILQYAKWQNLKKIIDKGLYNGETADDIAKRKEKTIKRKNFINKEY